MSSTFVFSASGPDPAARLGPVSLTTARVAVKLIDAASRTLEWNVDEARLLLERATEVLETDTDLVRRSRAPGLTAWQRRRVLAHVEARLGDRVSLDDFAAVTRLSRSGFARAFKVSFDQTPHAYMTACRVAAAQVAMVSGDRPLCEIALDCGFGDQAHFTRVFGRVVGRSPHAWRRLAKAGAGGGDAG